MKENFENKVITLADGETANSLRGAALAGIGISETDAESCFTDAADCVQNWQCCTCKFICLKLVTEDISSYLILKCFR